MTEQQPYRVLREFDDFELREYPACMIAEVQLATSFEQAGNGAFASLFGYISGRNRARQSIAMTAPVLQREAGSGLQAVAFVMPEALTTSGAPEPDDGSVTVHAVPGSTTAAVRYSGVWSRARFEQHRDRLMAAMSREGLSPIGEPRFARYNPPFTPWFLRRNEVLVDVAAV